MAPQAQQTRIRREIKTEGQKSPNPYAKSAKNIRKVKRKK
jgi:hypothetical protein